MNALHIFCTAALAAVTHAAHAQVVVIANPAVGSMTKEQVADLFLGKNLTLTPIDQLESAFIYSDFYKKVSGRDAAQVKATWSRLVFTGKAQAPKQMADVTSLKKAIASDPKAVGYIDRAAVDATVKVVLTLD